MAIELTTASNTQKKQIRDALNAVGEWNSTNNTFSLFGTTITTGTVIITGGPGQDTGLIIPNGQISLGYSASQYGNVNDGAVLLFESADNDDGQLVIQTRDNGDEPIVFRQVGGTPNVKEPLVIGKNNAIGVNPPAFTRTFPSTLTVYGNISASGSIFVQSIVENSPSPLTIDVTSSVPALKVIQRGTGDVLEVVDPTNLNSDALRVNNSGRVVIGAKSSETSSFLNAANLNVVQRDDGTGAAFLRSFKFGTNPSLFNSIQFYSTRGSSIDSIVELSASDRLFGMRGLIADPSFGFYRGNAEFFAQLSPGKTIDGSSKPSDFVFRNNPDNDINTREVVRIDHAGRMGIGTSTPNELLTVVGNISASGTIFASNIQGGTTLTNVVTSPTTQTGGVSGIVDIRVLTQIAYNNLSPKNPNTLYVII